LAIKKAVEATGRPVRIVPNKTLDLNSAQVLHNKLTHRGGWELIFAKYGDSTILAQTLFVQDIEAYAARDQARPKRDARVGMLPPKLAQTLINLANPATGATVLDPFCGTGVVLQEAALMGYNVYGTDLEPRMIEYAKENLEWLKGVYPQIANVEVRFEVADATNHRWSRPFDTVVGETFLGRALTALPDSQTLSGIIRDTDTILRKFLANLATQLPKDTRISLAVPAWKKKEGGFHHLPLIDHLTEMGYNRLDFKHSSYRELIYHRPAATVARQLLVLVKK
jgi:tRNA (guanine10-N2)-dimethyltransferase